MKYTLFITSQNEDLLPPIPLYLYFFLAVKALLGSSLLFSLPISQDSKYTTALTATFVLRRPSQIIFHEHAWGQWTPKSPCCGFHPLPFCSWHHHILPGGPAPSTPPRPAPVMTSVKIIETIGTSFAERRLCLQLSNWSSDLILTILQCWVDHPSASLQQTVVLFQNSEQEEEKSQL